MKKDFKNGFTLIELVIIMVILGVLAAVAIPRIGNTIDSSEVSAEEAVIGSLRSALEVYAMDQVVMNSNKSYPPNPFDALHSVDLGNSWSDFEPKRTSMTLDAMEVLVFPKRGQRRLHFRLLRNPKCWEDGAVAIWIAHHHSR